MQYTHLFTKLYINAIQTHRTKAKTYINIESAITRERPTGQETTDTETTAKETAEAKAP